MGLVLKQAVRNRKFLYGLAFFVFIGVFTLSFRDAYAISSVPTSGVPTYSVPGVSKSHIIVVHDDGEDIGFATKATTVREALIDGGIYVGRSDRTEPSLDQVLVANSYQVNIYRARPLVIVDGEQKTHVLSSYRTPKQIARESGIVLHDEDEVVFSMSSDPIEDGAAEIMTITRATEFRLDFYGKESAAYTMARTVGDMLIDKNIALGSNDGMNYKTDTPIKPGMKVRIWRNGVSTKTVEEKIAYETKTIYDKDQPVGYKEVRTKGEDGKRAVTYEVKMQNGKEVSRRKVNSVTLEKPTEEVVVVGAKNSGGLTQSKGVYMSTDSEGVTHRETYYDLPMNIVMRNCGQGGNYTVRSDGVKVDADGYVIIAAHLGNYPRCSIVETSLGLGKVYDTGGFTAVHPDGFDIATDWSNSDGI